MKWKEKVACLKIAFTWSYWGHTKKKKKKNGRKRQSDKRRKALEFFLIWRAEKTKWQKKESSGTFFDLKSSRTKPEEGWHWNCAVDSTRALLLPHFSSTSMRNLRLLFVDIHQFHSQLCPPNSTLWCKEKTSCLFLFFFGNRSEKSRISTFDYLFSCTTFSWNMFGTKPEEEKI